MNKLFPLGPHSQVFDPVDLGWDLKMAFLMTFPSSPQVMLRLLDLEPHFENHCAGLGPHVPCIFIEMSPGLRWGAFPAQSDVTKKVPCQWEWSDSIMLGKVWEGCMVRVRPCPSLFCGRWGIHLRAVCKIRGTQIFCVQLHWGVLSDSCLQLGQRERSWRERGGS